jgi:hypothetical protein
MERKECNAERKRSACPLKTNYISEFFLLIVNTKNILIKCDYLKKRRNLLES